MKKPFKLIAFFASLLIFIFVLAYLSLLDQRVTNKLDGALWTVPAKLYSRPLELAEGGYINIKNLLLELDLLSYEETGEVKNPGEFVYKDRTLKIFLRGFNDQKSGIFTINIENQKIKGIKRVDGIPLDLIRLEPMAIGGLYPAHMQDRLLLSRPQIPDELIQIILAVEDKSFFEHKGICYKCIIRAFVRNTKALEIEQGGSTITQQLAKSLFFSPEQTYRRKIKEALASFFIEFHYSKEEILLAYINDVFIAQSGKRAIHGFGLASQFFFGSSVNNLSTDQMALLVGMLQGPSLYNPLRNPQSAKKRRDLILNILLNNSILDIEKFSELKDRPIKIIKPTYKSQSKYPYFSDLVTLDLKKNFEDRDLRTKGLKIFTNLDPVVQRILEISMLEGKQDLLIKYGNKLEDLQGAAVVVDTFSGEVKAAIGNINPKNFGFNIKILFVIISPLIYQSSTIRTLQSLSIP